MTMRAICPSGGDCCEEPRHSRINRSLSQSSKHLKWMKGSVSSSSLDSNKPSTAGKRTRTVIVARPVPTSSTSDGVASSLVAAHPRDEKSGKLAAYAALGGAADLELFDQYLADQRQEPRAAELRYAAAPTSLTNPEHLKPSMKRKTISRLQLNGDDANGDEDQAVLLLMQHETEKDAHKRREALIAQRKWLKSLPINERLVHQRRQNALKKWQKINRDWEAFKSRTSKRLGKAEDQLVMSRASEYREQMEMYDALQKARPLSEKVGSDIWLVSLRGDGTRFVPVGNIFSGLYCPIRESTRIGPRIRRPLDYMQAEDMQRPAKHVSLMEKRSLELLAKKKWRLRKQLEFLLPHEVEASSSGELKVETMDLFQWASGANTKTGDEEMQASRDTDEDDIAISFDNQPELNEQPEPLPIRQNGPSGRIFIVADGEDFEELHRPESSSASPFCLSFYVDIGLQQQNRIALENDGSTVLHFRWTREQFKQDQISPFLATGWDGKSSKQTFTFISQSQGSILPGEQLEFSFSFRSKQAGVFLEKWLLDVDPPAEIKIVDPSKGTGMDNVDAIPAKSSPFRRSGTAFEPIEIHLYCTAVDCFVPKTERAKRLKSVSAQENVFMVEQIVQEMVGNIEIPDVASYADLSSEANQFYAVQRADVSATEESSFSDVYYSDSLISKCCELYNKARSVLFPVQTVNNDATCVEGDHVAESSDDTERKNVENQDSSADSFFAAEWDLKLQTLCDLAKAADETNEATTSRLKSERQKAIRRKEELDEQVDEDDDDDEDEEDDEAIQRKKDRLNLRISFIEKIGELESAISLLLPKLMDEFRAIHSAACTVPYKSSLLTASMTESIGALCSEVPLVLEIVRMEQQSSVLVETHNQMRQLFMRAIDEAVSIDIDDQAEYNRQRRKFQRVWLSDIPTYSTLLESATTWTHGGVLVLHVDLDLAHWFTLTRIDQQASTEVGDGSSRNDSSLEWQFSQALVEHDQFIPTKVSRAVRSIRALMEKSSESGIDIRAIALLSKLNSFPPLNKSMKKLLVGAAMAETPNASIEDRVLVEQKILQQLALSLSLKQIVPVLERALGMNVNFCSIFDELLTHLTPADASEENAPAAVDENESAVPSLQPPRVFLLEHMQELAKNELAGAVKLAVLAMQEALEVAPAPAADAKPSIPATGKKGAPATAAAKAPAVETKLTETPMSADPATERKIDIPPGWTRERVEIQALGCKIAASCDAFVGDLFVSPACEDLLKCTKNEHECKRIPVVLGPNLSKEVNVFVRCLQTESELADRSCVRAVVGGTRLDKKIRLIDSLLERVQAIYFVGEIALALYRLLIVKEHDKHQRLLRKSPLNTRRYHAWDVLIPALERLQQKAHRHNVALLLPFDWIVGESLLEEQDQTYEEDEDDDEVNEEQDEEEEEEEDEDEKPRKKRGNKVKKKKPCKPLIEPDEVDSWQKQKSYDGERAHVMLEGFPTWISLAQVTREAFERYQVVSGFSSALVPSSSAVDAEHEDSDTADHIIPVDMLDSVFDWTYRAFDVGPRSTQALIQELQTPTHDLPCNDLIWIGLFGAVEYRDFEVATREFVSFLAERSSFGLPAALQEGQDAAFGPSRVVLIAGQNTTQWIQRLEMGKPVQRRLVCSTDVNNALAWKHIVATKSCPMLDCMWPAIRSTSIWEEAQSSKSGAL